MTAATILYAFLSAIVASGTGAYESATILEGLTFADCEALMKSRVAQVAASKAPVRIYVACVPMPVVKDQK